MSLTFLFKIFLAFVFLSLGMWSTKVLTWDTHTFRCFVFSFFCFSSFFFFFYFLKDKDHSWFLPMEWLKKVNIKISTTTVVSMVSKERDTPDVKRTRENIKLAKRDCIPYMSVSSLWGFFINRYAAADD